MAKIRRLVLDVVVPSASDILKLTQELAGMEGVNGTSSFVNEFDKKVTNIKLIIEGADLNFTRIEKVVGSHGGSIHSMDNISAGKAIVEDVKTPQD